jgi:predicted anti-sigma-YlaC factor YlaD
MSCNQSLKYLQSEIDGAEFKLHLKECKTCSELFGKINETISILDEEVEIPMALTENVMKGISRMEVPQGRTLIDLNKYLQLAAVVAVGIFLGVLLGSRADKQIFLSKKDKKEKALIEYRMSHHLSDQDNINCF